MYDFHPDSLQFWARGAIIALLLALGAYGVRNRRVPAAKPFAAGAFMLGLALICLLLEGAATDPPPMFLWYRLHNAAMLYGATATAAFCLEYAYPGRWLTLRNLLIAALPCVFVTFALFLSAEQGPFWRSVTMGDWVVADRTPLATAMLAYGWALLFVNLAALSWLFARSPQHRRPLALLIGGQIASRLIFALQYFGPAPGRSPDLVFTSTAVPFVFYAVGLFGFRLFDPLPAAFATAVQQMREGMLVFALDGLLLNLNPAAAQLLGPRASRRPAKTWCDVFPGLPLPSAEIGEALETSLGPAGGERRYALELTPLADQRGVRTGLLVLLHDVTEQRAVQARAAEQQGVQAVLQEREHLAHELHDGLSQELAFLNMQAQAAQLYLASGQVAAAHATLERLAAVARGMQGDTRELIGNLLYVSLGAECFYDALCDLSHRFESQTGLQVTLVADGAAQAACGPHILPAATAVQLLRIVQETLANVRKHAGRPDHVEISVVAHDGCVRLTVADDGIGFDPRQVDSATGEVRSHYGLQVMRGRAQRFGGELMVDSTPGAGTRVTVCAPLRSVTPVGRSI